MMTPINPARNTQQDPNAVYEPIHWVHGGEARFIVCVLVILLIWWGWLTLTREIRELREQEDEDA